MAQIINTESNVVTSEGISYGMTAAVHLDKKKEFNKLWNWARFHMQQTAGEFESAWHCALLGLLRMCVGVSLHRVCPQILDMSP